MCLLYLCLLLALKMFNVFIAIFARGKYALNDVFKPNYLDIFKPNYLDKAWLFSETFLIYATTLHLYFKFGPCTPRNSRCMRVNKLRLSWEYWVNSESHMSSCFWHCSVLWWQSLCCCQYSLESHIRLMVSADTICISIVTWNLMKFWIHDGMATV